MELFTYKLLVDSITEVVTMLLKDMRMMLILCYKCYTHLIFSLCGFRNVSNIPLFRYVRTRTPLFLMVSCIYPSFMFSLLSLLPLMFQTSFTTKGLLVELQIWLFKNQGIEGRAVQTTINTSLHEKWSSITVCSWVRVTLPWPGVSTGKVETSAICQGRTVLITNLCLITSQFQNHLQGHLHGHLIDHLHLISDSISDPISSQLYDHLHDCPRDCLCDCHVDHLHLITCKLHDHAKSVLECDFGVVRRFGIVECLEMSEVVRCLDGLWLQLQCCAHNRYDPVFWSIGDVRDRWR